MGEGRLWGRGKGGVVELGGLDLAMGVGRGGGGGHGGAHGFLKVHGFWTAWVCLEVHGDGVAAAAFRSSPSATGGRGLHVGTCEM